MIAEEEPAEVAAAKEAVEAEAAAVAAAMAVATRIADTERATAMAEAAATKAGEEKEGFILRPATVVEETAGPIRATCRCMMIVKESLAQRVAAVVAAWEEGEKEKGRPWVLAYLKRECVVYVLPGVGVAFISRHEARLPGGGAATA